MVFAFKGTSIDNADVQVETVENTTITTPEHTVTVQISSPNYKSNESITTSEVTTKNTKNTETTKKTTKEQTTTKQTTTKQTTTTKVTTNKPVKTTTQVITTTKPVETTTHIKTTTPVAFNGYNLTLSENDMMMMCTIVSSETGYCEDMAQKAVAHTIINRLVSDKFPNDMYSVCTQENQYTAIHSYFDGQYRAGLAPGSAGWNYTMQLCYEALNEYDFTNGAFAYYNPNMCGYNSWFESLTLTYADQYGRFFKW